MSPRKPRGRPARSADVGAPGSTPSWLVPAESRPQSAGGPATRPDSALGKLLANLLAFFEVRTVSGREIDLVRPTHENGWLLPQIQAKLNCLHPECPDHAELRRLVELSLELLSAVDSRRFDPGPAWAEVEPRLLRALAYFVRDGDAIPDHLPQGFDDDMREFKELAERAGDLFGIFEAYSLRRPKAAQTRPNAPR